MKKRTLYYSLIVSALLPASLLFLGSLIALSNMHPPHLVLGIILWIAGYFGLFLLLFQKPKDAALVNVLLLICGITGFVLLSSWLGGMENWKSVLLAEEPIEWFIFIWPHLVQLFFVIIGCISIAKRLKHSPK